MKMVNKQSRLEQEQVALSKGLELISHELVNKAKLYRFILCGHEKRIQLGHVRNGSFKCRHCEIRDYTTLCKDNGIEILGPADNGDPNYKKIRFIACQHERIATLESAKNGEVKCKVCQDITYQADAEKNNCKFIGKSDEPQCGMYQLPCGHVNKVQPGNIKRGIFRCIECKSSYKTRKSYVYIVKLMRNNHTFIKIGFAADPNRRLKSMMKNGTTFEIIEVKEFDSGIDANKYETRLHLALKHHRVKSDITKQFLKSGWTECFYTPVLEELFIADLFVYLGENYL